MTPWTLRDLETRLAELGGARGDPNGPRERTRVRIMDAATEHFVRFGYRRASVSDIARDAGVGKGTVYLYFDGKATLLAACVAREKMALLAPLATVLALPPPEQLEAYLRLGLKFALTSRLSGALLRGDQDLKVLMDDLGQHQLEADSGKSLALVAGFISEVAPGLTEHHRQQLAAMLNAVLGLPAHLTDPRLRSGLGVEAFVELYAGVLARGIAATRPS